MTRAKHCAERTFGRRDLLRMVGTAATWGPVSTACAALGASLPDYTVRGVGPAIVTFRRSPDGFFNALTDRYRVIELDYPPANLPDDFVASFTPGRVCSDVLAVADAVGADRFAWFGFSWGAVVGLQLAVRTTRLTALMCGGWPPLEARYDAMVPGGGREGDSRAYDTFYRELRDWPQRQAVSTIAVPRMAFAGRQDVIEAYGTTFPHGPTLERTQRELERLGWSVRLLDGFGHELGARPDVVIPLIREFLDPILLARPGSAVRP